MRTNHSAYTLAKAKQTKSRFRQELKRHNHRVVITDCVDRGRYVSYVVSYYLGGRRKQVRRANLDEARLEANLVLTKLAQGEPDVLALTSTDRLIYLRACEALATINVPLDVAISEYVHARNILKGVGTITEAAHHYVKQYSGFKSTVLVQQAVDELLTARRADGSSPVHVADLECRLGVFSKAFACPLCEVRDSDIYDFLLNLKFEPRTKNNYRTAISNLFTFARLKRFVPQGYDHLQCVPEFKEPHQPIDILTVDELTLLFGKVQPNFRAYLAIAAFAGLRQSEIQRLRWEHIKGDYIHVPPGQYRVKSTRYVPIQPNLKAWLAICPKSDGMVVPYKNPTNNLAKLFADAEVELKHNCLRHSFGSYRIAVTQNIHSTSLEMGNSPSMIRKHYMEVVTKETGAAWFDIKPPDPVQSPEATPESSATAAQQPTGA